MQSNVKETSTTNTADSPNGTTLPVEIRCDEKNRTGDEANQNRIEELRMQGLRPKDARRLERLERTLNLPAEKHELQRVWAAARLRADPSLRNDVLAQIIHQVVIGEATEYEGLLRLKDLEVVGEECDFARFVQRQHGSDRFVCYVDGEPQFAVRYTPPFWPDDDPKAYVLDTEKASALPD